MKCYSVLLLLSLSVVSVVPRSVSAPSAEEVEAEKTATWASELDCPVHTNAALHAVMNRICEMCHEMFSHSQPNMHAQCRADCFRSEQFKSCLELFTPKRPTRHNRTN